MTIQLKFDIALLTATLNIIVSALTRPGGANAVVMQSNCVQWTWWRSLHSNCLRRGSNLYALQAERSNQSATVHTVKLHGSKLWMSSTQS